jgi:hypothetical protein
VVPLLTQQITGDLAVEFSYDYYCDSLTDSFEMSLKSRVGTDAVIMEG